MTPKRLVYTFMLLPFYCYSFGQQEKSLDDYLWGGKR